MWGFEDFKGLFFQFVLLCDALRVKQITASPRTVNRHPYWTPNRRCGALIRRCRRCLRHACGELNRKHSRAKTSSNWLFLVNGELLQVSGRSDTIQTISVHHTHSPHEGKLFPLPSIPFRLHIGSKWSALIVRSHALYLKYLKLVFSSVERHPVVLWVTSPRRPPFTNSHSLLALSISI